MFYVLYVQPLLICSGLLVPHTAAYDTGMPVSHAVTTMGFWILDEKRI
eukprot:COSAG01_NODE_58233_length_307_cov_0.865385_1_plen_47_part_01